MKILAWTILIVGLGCLGWGVFAYFKPPNSNATNSNTAMSVPVEHKINTSEKKVIFKQELDVPPNVEWFNTGLDITDKYIRITVTPGRLWTNTTTSDPYSIYQDAKGNTAGTTWPGLIVPGQPIRTLVGKTNNQTFSFSNDYKIEGKFGSGMLRLSMNDVAGTFNDNGGSSQHVVVEYLE